ncbi:MAG TPA: elongation factor G [Phycisphaerae bacterium]|nr:elongation factor G [Phycisphaerae bacterium]
MPAYTTQDIRNIALVGHAAAGKTSLCEAFLHSTGATTRLGSVAAKSSHLDTDDEEREGAHSIDSHVMHVSVHKKEINVIDTPGSPDFIGPAVAALGAVETALTVVNAAAGIQVNTRRLRDYAKNFGLARVIVVNHIDAENADLGALLGLLRKSFGDVLTPVNLPTGGGKAVIDCISNAAGDADFGSVAEAHTSIVERVSECDDGLIAKYFEQGELSDEEVRGNFVKAIVAGTIVPVVYTNALKDVGVKELLNFIADCCPSPIEGRQRKLVHGDKEEPIKLDGRFVGRVFKVAIDPKSHIKYPFIRCYGGTLKPDSQVVLSGERKGNRSGHLMKFSGNEHKDIDVAIAGDIFAVAKLDLKVAETVFDDAGEGRVEAPKVPTPMYSLAVTSKARGDEAKIGDAVRRFSETDPCFRAVHDPQTHELVISGTGDQHLRLILSRMHRHFKLDVDTKPPKIPYRETITAKAEGHYRHKKQTGGAGQFGEVYLSVEPLERGSEPTLSWNWDIFGGTIPTNFEPAVRKGVSELMVEGALAGFHLQDVKVSITDGKHHAVDSKEVAFKIAGKLAFKEAILKAKPVLLEPIVNVQVTVPADHVGDITGDLAQRRGRPTGQEALPGDFALIEAQVPLAKLSDYHSRLSSMTGGKGSFSMEFSHYENVPSNEAQAVIAKYQPRKSEEE